MRRMSLYNQLQLYTRRYPFYPVYVSYALSRRQQQHHHYGHLSHHHRYHHRHISSLYPHRFFSSHRDRGSSLIQSNSRLSDSQQDEFLSLISQPYIRNFSIIAHIDHGKSTLADRLLEYAGNIDILTKQDAQILDNLQIERERGITVKAQTASIFYRYHISSPIDNQNSHTINNQPYLLNLIDTPGHVDFSYEVSRSFAACQGALLLVDASQGIQAQTLANYHTAKEAGLDIIPIITKIDLPHADVKGVSQQILSAFNIDPKDIICVSSKTGENIHQVFPAIVERIRPPTGRAINYHNVNNNNNTVLTEVSKSSTESPNEVSLRALLFDSWYSTHRGVICLLCVIDGDLHTGDKIGTYHEQHQYEVQELGLLMPHNKIVQTLHTGQVGYMIAGIRSTREARLGETIYRLASKKHRGLISQQQWTLIRSQIDPLAGFSKAKSMVYAGLFPATQSDFESLSDAIDKLTLNDASVQIQKESSLALGLGFRCGFLGVLHMDVFSSRLEQEFGAAVIITAPTVPYEAVLHDGSQLLIDSPNKFISNTSEVSHYLEPMVLATIITPHTYQGTIMELCNTSRGILLDIVNIGDTMMMKLSYQLPLSEILMDFYDNIKTLSSGYASFDYQADTNNNGSKYIMERADLCKIEIRINNHSVDALSLIVHRDKSDILARKIVTKLRDTIDRTNFEIIIQACIGHKIVARDRIAPYRKDVLIKSGKLVGGGDVTRKKKLLEKQKEGKKKMKMIGNVELNEQVFTAVMKLS